MYRYTIGEDFFEDYHDCELLHKQKYTNEEFKILCKQAFNRMSYEGRKLILESFGSSGSWEIRKVLVEEFGFEMPDKILAHIHIMELFGDYIDCEDCPKFYLINNERRCSNPECEYKDYNRNEDD